MITRALAIDPGSAKCGIAVVSTVAGVETRIIVPVADVPTTTKRLIDMFSPEIVLVGDGTCSGPITKLIADVPIPLICVDEKLTTEKARVRYFEDHPPRGLKRLIPRGLILPPEPYDDYAAVVIAERYLLGQK